MTQNKELNVEITAKSLFLQLLSEVPPKTVLWKTMNGPLTAQNLIDDLNNNGSDSKKYLIDLMRLSRDILAARIK